LHCSGVLRCFIVEAAQLRETEKNQDPYVTIELLPPSRSRAGGSSSGKPFASTVAEDAGAAARWLESCDMHLTTAEAQALHAAATAATNAANTSANGSGSDGAARVKVTVVDKDVIDGDDVIGEATLALTPSSLLSRAASVSWRALAIGGRPAGFIRLGFSWHPDARAPVAVTTLRPDEAVEAGALYVWLMEARDLRDASFLSRRAMDPPLCEVELRPYAKKGRKRAKEVEATAREPEPDSPALDRGTWHRLLRLEFQPVSRAEDRVLSETAPTAVLSVHDRPLGKKVVLGAAEVLLASLCGKGRSEAPLVAAAATAATAGGTAMAAAKGAERGVSESSPSVVDRTVTLLHEGARAGEVRLQAIYVPDRLQDLPAAAAAIKALAKAAESALHAFKARSEAGANAAVAANAAAAVAGAAPASSAGGSAANWTSPSLSSSGGSGATAGTLEVLLLRATELHEVEGRQDPLVELRLLGSAGAEMRRTETAKDAGAAPEWNCRFSLHVDNADAEMLELCVKDGNNVLGNKKSIGRCVIPLLRYAVAAAAAAAAGRPPPDPAQATPESFRLMDARGKDFRGNLVLAVGFLGEPPGQAVLLQNHCVAPGGAAAGRLHVRICSLEGGSGAAAAADARYRVRVSLRGITTRSRTAETTARGGGSAVQTVQTPEARWDAASDCARWGSTIGAAAAAHACGNPSRVTTGTSGAELSLPWSPAVTETAWTAGGPELHFEVLKSGGDAAAPTFVASIPVAGMLWRRGAVLERALTLTRPDGLVPVASGGGSSGGGGDAVTAAVTLVVALQFLPDSNSTKSAATLPAGASAATAATAVVATGASSAVASASSTGISAGSGRQAGPFQEEAEEAPPMNGQVVVSCLRARNLPESSAKNPLLRLLLSPDGGTADTDEAHDVGSDGGGGGGGRHPVWNQSRVLPVSDALTARLRVAVVEPGGGGVLAVFGAGGARVVGEVELPMAGLLAAAEAIDAAADANKAASAAAAVAAAAAATTAAAAGQQAATSAGAGEAAAVALAGRGAAAAAKATAGAPGAGGWRKSKNDGIGTGAEAWFPLFVSSPSDAKHGGGGGDAVHRERVGEVRLGIRFLAADFMLQRELFRSADDGDRGPMGPYR
ncbi:unnamed protein product, partial [Phaeothamnion confervicola]